MNAYTDSGRKAASYQKQRMTCPWAVFIAAGFFCLFMTPYKSFAATLSAVEVTKLTFGTLQKPASGTQTFTIDSKTGATSGTGTLLYGSPTAGLYTLTCTGCGGSITIDIQNINSGNANVTISAFTGSYNGHSDNINSFPVSGKANPGTGGKDLYLGATATYNSSVPTTPITPSFDIVLSQP